MKTAEELYTESVGRGDMNWDVEFNKREFFEFVEKIQLDAIRHGMSLAAEIAANHRSHDATGNHASLSGVLRLAAQDDLHP